MDDAQEATPGGVRRPARARPATPAVDQALAILTHLARQRGPVTAGHLATALRIPRASLYRQLASMVDHGYVVHLPEESRYGLGVAAYELGSGYSRQQPLSRLGAPLIAGLVDRVGESAHLAVLEGRDVVYVVEQRAPRRPMLITDVGVRLSALVTASGRAILAALPHAQLRATFPGPAAFESAPQGAPRSYRELKELVRVTRARGYSWEDGSVTEGLASVAVPVRDHAGWPVAALAVTFPSERGDDTWRERVVEAVTRDADELARRIGARRTG
ncbi:IclR family transcriptional regulator [Demequina capsici]|uniref:IclR family transcriptional regulator n=1 Tax=Demequina capsici TaxID=3075620 RepID=A0AA96F6K8_9MICO|nr:IclR family transcriptional regulator [Demequina sp. OYTSA14]WNM23732.1 IclR family transcriptional regulator [Demequina sp. OYTSA14]